jgi:hypothetical protein
MLFEFGHDNESWVSITVEFLYRLNTYECFNEVHAAWICDDTAEIKQVYHQNYVFVSMLLVCTGLV